jgi:hypothetical protein
MTAAIDLVPEDVREWLIEHGVMVGRATRIGEAAARVMVAFTELQNCAQGDVQAAVEAVQEAIEKFEAAIMWVD